MHQKQLSCAVFADSKTLITAGLDCTVAVWTMTTGAKAVDLQPRTTLFGHMAPVTVIATSKSYNALLCVSAQGQASLWDLNRLIFVRNLPAQDPVEVGRSPAPLVFLRLSCRLKCARINDVNGDIVLCHRQSVAMYTLNGQQILTQQVCGASDDKDDCISSCAFYEGVGNEWLERELLLTGHKRGVVNVMVPLQPSLWKSDYSRRTGILTIVQIWDKTVDEKAGCFKLCLIKRLDHIHVTPGPPPAPAPPSLSMLSTSTSQRQPLRPAFKSASPASRGGGRGGAHGTTSNNISARITCILPMVQTLYTGDDEGRVVCKVSSAYPLSLSVDTIISMIYVLLLSLSLSLSLYSTPPLSATYLPPFRIPSSASHLKYNPPPPPPPPSNTRYQRDAIERTISD